MVLASCCTVFNVGLCNSEIPQMLLDLYLSNFYKTPFFLGVLVPGSEETSLYFYMATIIVYIGVGRNFKVGFMHYAVMFTKSFWTDFRMKCVSSIIIQQLKKHSQ